jgi:hypothetical protein
MEMYALIATCGLDSPPTRALWIVGPPVIVAIWGWIVWRIAWRTGESDRLKLFLILAVAAVVGAFVFLYPHGISGNGNYLNRFWLSLGLATALGAVSSLLPPRVGFARSVITAIAGDVFLPGGLVLLFVWALALSGSCLD